MKLHQFFEARQMKDPTKDSLVSRNGKVIVIDKEHEDEYLKKGWELAEAYPIYKTKDYLDRQDRNLKKTPKEKPKKITKISDLVKDLSGKSTKLRDFGKGIFKFDESRFRSWLYDTYGKSIEELKGNDYAILSKEFQKQKKVTKVSDLTKDLSGKSTKLRDFGKGIFKFESDREEPESNCCGAPFDFETFDGYDGRCSACGEMAPDANIEPKEALDPKTATKKQIRQADVKGEIGAKYKDMKAGEFAKAHGDQWRKKKPVVHSTKKDKLVSLKVAKEEKYPQSLLLKGDEDAAKKSKAERQKDKDTKLKLAKEETDYSMPRSKREKEQAKNSATNEFTPDHIHYATMKRVKAYDKTRKTEEASKKHGIDTGEWQKHMGSERGVKRKVEKMTRKAGKKEIRQQTQAQEGAFIDQLEPEWSEGKRRLGNEIRAKLGMKQLPELDWKKDIEMKHARRALKARFAEVNDLRKRAGLEEKDEWDDSNVWDKESDRWFNSILGDDDEAHYEDWMTAFAQCEPGSKECDILLTHEVFSNMLSDGPLDEFDDLYKAYDEGKADENMIRKYQELAKSHLESDKARFAEGEERSDVQALMREKCEEWLANVQPGSYLGYEDLESDMYDYARGLTHDDLGSGDDLRNFMDNPGDEAGQVVQDVLASNHRVEIEDLFAEGVESPSKEEIMKVLPHLHDEYVKTGRYNAFELSNILKQMYPELGRREASNYVADFFKTFKEGVISNPESYSKEENQVSAILGKALGKSPDEALRYAPGELFSELESVNPELADSIASISSIVYNVKLEEKYDGYYLAQRAADLWHKDNPNKRRDGYFRVGVDVQDEYAEKAGGKKGKYRGHGASEWTTEEKVGEKLRKSTLPKITQADKDDAVDFLGSIKRTDPNAYKRLIKRLKD